MDKDNCRGKVKNEDVFRRISDMRNLVVDIRREENRIGYISPMED